MFVTHGTRIGDLWNAKSAKPQVRAARRSRFGTSLSPEAVGFLSGNEAQLESMQPEEAKEAENIEVAQCEE